MVQSVNILQMNTRELTEFIEKESMENPVVELETKNIEQEQEERIRKLEWLSSFDEQNRTYQQYDRDEEEEKDRTGNLSTGDADSLEDVLRLQLMASKYRDYRPEIFEYIIQSLDKRGFFTETAAELAKRFKVRESEAQRHLAAVRDLEPAGVCAESLVESLLKQIEKREDCGETEQIIVSEYLDLLGKNQLHVIAKKMNLSILEIQDAVSKIKTLQPYPSQGFGIDEPVRYVVPDIRIVRVEDHFEISVNDYSYPVLHVSKEYLQMMKSNCGKDVKDYLHGKIKRIEELQECIVRRNNTLYSLAQCILTRQQLFFLTGRQTDLKPYRMQEVAEKLEVHDSTISRAVKDKYLQCKWGIFPLSYFFPKGMSSATYGDEDIAVAEIKQKLKDIIDKENKSKPLSDQKIAEMLAEGGIDISRRTVVKYRESMGIPNSRSRKDF